MFHACQQISEVESIARDMGIHPVQTTFVSQAWLPCTQPQSHFNRVSFLALVFLLFDCRRRVADDRLVGYFCLVRLSYVVALSSLTSHTGR